MVLQSGERLRARAAAQGLVAVVFCFLCTVAGLWTPFPARAETSLSDFGKASIAGAGHASSMANVNTPATPPARYNEPLPAADSNSDSVGATPATFRVDESGAAVYSAPIYLVPGTAGLVPSLSLEYNSRAQNGPLGPGWSLGGLSSISRCKRATEYGDGAGPFPGINFDGVAADQAYCVDGARLLDLNVSPGNCPAGPAGSTAQVFALELDPATRVCGYTTAAITGYAFWLVQPKDGSDRVYGVGGNSALVHNDGTSADTTQYLSWALSRIADSTGNTVEFSYNQSATTGEMDIAQIGYTGKIALTEVLKAAPSFTRAPYANITFTYTTLAAASQRTDYIAGMKLALTQQLSTITVNGPINNGATPNTLATARTYHLHYGTPTASSLSALTSLQECAPNGASEVCYPSTQFIWNNYNSQGGFPSAPSSAAYGGGLQYAIDTKVGDVDGDGRQDIVWLKDHTCDNTGSGAQRFELMVSLAKGTSFAAPIASGVYLTRPPASGQVLLPTCGADWRPFHFETLWFLYDFSGDGRDDVLTSNGSAWNIYPTIAKGAGFAFDGANPVSTGMGSLATDDGIFADINGDGLPDLVHQIPATGGITSNLLQPAASGTLTFGFGATSYNLNPTLPPGATDYFLGFAPQPGRSVQNADLNGDGASDFVFQVTIDNGVCGGPIPQGTGNTTSSGATIHFQPSSQPAQLACPVYWYTFRNMGFTGGAIPTFDLTYESQIGQVGSGPGKLPSDGSFISLVDLNGDGQADLLYPKFDASGNYVYSYRLNGGKTGDAAATERFVAEQSVGLTLTKSFAERIQFLDLNGDHRTDILYQQCASPPCASYPLKALLWGGSGPTGFGSPVDVGNSTINAQNPTIVESFLIDVEGKGAPDIVRFDAANTTLSIYSNAATFGGSDALTGITNGLGALTALIYYPLAYTAGYSRAYDGPAQSWGRSSPVFDVFSAIWVVHKAVSSAPTAADPLAQSSVVYRYSGARVQSGGRGFLGFKTVQSENLQPTQDTSKFLVTTTQYRQDFPFTGRPEHTVVELESALQADPCVNAPGDSCFAHDPPPCGTGGIRCNKPALESFGVGGQVLSDSADQYTSNPVFAPGTMKPVLPYLFSSDEQKFDVTSSGTLSHEITSTFTEDTYGNVTSSSVISSETSGIDETKTMANVYGCTVAPPTIAGCVGGALSAEWKRLGRLSLSTVTSARPGQSNNVRRVSFEYDATTLQRIAEIQGPYDDLEPDPIVRKTLGLRSDLVRDTDGNVIEQVQCSTFHFANRAACIDLSGFQQRQYSADLTKIQRYATFAYESLGRFQLNKNVPFYDGTTAGSLSVAEASGLNTSGCAGSLSGALSARPGAGITALTGGCTFVINRDVFGNPLNQLAATGDQSAMAYGLLGRAHFSEDVTTGAFSRSTTTWCKDVTNADIPAAAPRANCPVGAVYRETTDSTASGIYAGQSIAPTTYAYFDALGRGILSTQRIYQSAGTQNWSSVVSAYDSTGRAATASVPFFSVDPTAAQGIASTRAGYPLNGITAALATSTYDAVDRAKKLTHPEEAANTPSSSAWTYSTLTTNAQNPRGYTSVQVKNARDEVVSVTDPGALKVSYARDAVGNITDVKRTPSDGDSAGVLIDTNLFYDRLGRKTSMTDPDKGAWVYNYNALGELVGQQDAKGQTLALYRDALGRLYQRNENRLSGGNYTSEPTSTWEFDTATRSDSSALHAMLHIESNGIGGFSRTTAFNDYGRVASVASNLDTFTYTERQTYDQFGRPYQHFDANTDAASPNGELTEYSTDGYPIDTREASGGVAGTMYDQVLSLSERGQVLQEEFHQNATLTTTRSYDTNTGRVLTINTASGALQNWTFDYDKHSNLAYRWNQTTGYNLKETLAYDTLDRLHTVTLSINGSAGSPLTVGYDQLGNLKSKTVGANTQNWVYGGSSGCPQVVGPHAVRTWNGVTYCYDANGNQTTANYGGGQTRTITYTGYDMAAQIVTNGTPSVATESFAYAPDRSMWKRAENSSAGGGNDKIFCNGFDTGTNTCPNAGGTSAATYFVGNVEARVNGATTTLKRYIGGYLVITTTTTGAVTSNPVFAYLFRDALGSIDVITNENAVVQQRQSFDAWGNRRDASVGGGWGLFSPGVAASFDTSTTYQGFTGHQQLDPVGLIHMRGRLYDPALGRFIQADPMTEADATQGLNRYSYVLNNPLSLTDPSGYLSFRQVLGIAIGVAAACFGQWEISIHAWGWAFATAVAGGFLSAYVATGSLKAGLWGAFTGAVFFGIGAGFSQIQGAAGTGFAGSGFSEGAFAANVAAHGAAGGVLNTMQGGNFGNGFITSGATAALSPAIQKVGNGPVRVVAAAMIGGTVSKVTGGSFANGATTAAFQEAFAEALNRTGSAEEGSGESDHVGINGRLASRVSTLGEDGVEAIDFGRPTFAWDPSIPTDIAVAYANAAAAGWTTAVTDARGVYISNLDVFIVGPVSSPSLSAADIYLTPCVPEVCTSGLGAAEAGGRMIWYSPNGYSDTPIHEFGHIFGFLDNRPAGVNSIMSGDRPRSVTPSDIDLLYKGYNGGH